MASGESLPGYARMLSAYHQAFEDELRAMVGVLPIAEGDRVLDLACGDGVYARWFAERVGVTGEVVALDISTAYLEVARAGARRDPNGHRIRFAEGEIERLPFADDSFDLVWLAQTLFTFPDPVDVLRRMRRVVRPGGMVAILEDDTLHQVLLPWPIEVELAVRRAELRGFIEESEAPRKFYVGRRLVQAFRVAGLMDCRKRTLASNRQAPLGEPERVFLEEYLRDLRGRVRPHLDPPLLERFERLVDPDSNDFLLDDPDLSVTCIDHVVYGVKPGSSV